MNLKEKKLKKIKKQILGCRKCTLYKKRKQPVVGSGDLNAKIMFIAEAPGYWEDVKGEPFVGRAGKILDELLASVKIKREGVFVANILKCRPPENRSPKKEEIKACTPYLLKQIEIIKPKVIATLGNFSTAFIFSTFNGSLVALRRHSDGASATFSRPSQPKLLQRSRHESGKKYGLEKKLKGISKIHGQIFRKDKTTIIPFFHPAVAVYNNKMKKILKKDFKILKKF